MPNKRGEEPLLVPIAYKQSLHTDFDTFYFYLETKKNNYL
jgi:hypothetical protein